MPNNDARATPPLKARLIILGLFIAMFSFFGYRAMASDSSVPKATFTLLSGQKINTEDLKGRVYLINFWDTGCAACVKNMPHWVETYKRYKHAGVDLVAVAMQYDSPMYVANYTESRALPFMVAIDHDGSAAKAFGDVQLTPTTLVVDKDGTILKRYVGEPQWDGLRKLLDHALAGNV